LLRGSNRGTDQRGRHHLGREGGGQAGIELSEGWLRDEAEVNRLRQPRGSALNIEAGAKRNPVEQPIGDRRLNIEGR
jgi:hypothetical protein